MSFSFFGRVRTGGRAARRVASSLLLVAPSALLACVTPDPTNLDAKSAADNRLRDVEIHHEACDVGSDSKTVDVNGDGRPDIVHVTKDGREACRIVDLNFDGAVDVYIFYDEKGAERRREADFDRDGRPDQVSLYQGGKLTENDRETNFDDKLDTWDYYQAGVLARRERDSDGDAIIDQWWQFYDPARPRCATVASDRNADGKPDADSQVDLCSDGTSPPAPVTAPPAPGAPTAPAAPATAAPGAPALPGAAKATAAPPASAPVPAPTP